MFDRALKRMREQVRARRYIMSLHAEEEMDADGLTIYDVESVILTGQVRTSGKADGLILEPLKATGASHLTSNSICMVYRRNNSNCRGGSCARPSGPRAPTGSDF